MPRIRAGQIGATTDRGRFVGHVRDEGSLNGSAASAGTAVTQLEAAFSLANSKTATGPQLRSLAGSESDLVRGSVAGNRNAPAETVYDLAHDVDPLIRDIARRHPAYSPRTSGEKFRRTVSRVYRGAPQAAFAA